MWDSVNPYRATGLKPSAPSPSNVAHMPGVARSAGPGVDDQPKPWQPDSPLFWFAALAAVTVGLIAASTSFRVGPVKVSASAGKS